MGWFSGDGQLGDGVLGLIGCLLLSLRLALLPSYNYYYNNNNTMEIIFNSLKQFI